MANTKDPAQRRRTRAILLVAVAAVLVVQQLSLSPAAAATFSNTAPITVPPLGPSVPPPWPATPYPSNIAVSGLSGTVTEVSVTLNGFSCNSQGPDFSFPEDNDILLVGPSGANLLMLSDIGGQNQNTPLLFGPIDVTLDDDAANLLPADTQLAAGTYRPLDDDNDPPFFFGAIPQDAPGDPFPAPAPAPSAATAFSVFDGTAPNGTWSLYLADDVQGPNTCSITNGWTLDVTASGGGGTTTSTTPAPTTTTSMAPTTTTSMAPTTTTSMAPTTTTSVAPTTTTSVAPTTTTSVAPTTTTSMAPTTTTSMAPTTTTSMAPTTTTSVAPSTTTSVAPTTTTSMAPTTTTSMAPTTTTSVAPTTTTSTTQVPPGGPISIDDGAQSNGDATRLTGTITCDAGNRYRIQIAVVQGDTEGEGTGTGTCTGDPQSYRVIVRTVSGPGFENGPAQADAVAEIGDPATRTVVDTFSTSEEVEIDVPAGMAAAMLDAIQSMENRKG